MKKLILFQLLIIFTITFSFGQTKLISHKSHSGSTSNFSLALENNLFDLAASDFGIAPEPFVQVAILDSLIYVSDSVVVMVTSEHCYRGDFSDRQKFNKKRAHIWKAGRDTLLFHPLFQHQHAKDSIKQVIDSLYHFVNPADSIAFVGYDNLAKSILTPRQFANPVDSVVLIGFDNPKPEQPKIEDSSLSKKAARKAKRKQKKLERKKKKAQNRLKKDAEKKQPVIKPAVLPLTDNDPKDPPANLDFLKVGLVLLLFGLSLIFGLFYKKKQETKALKV